VQGTALTVTNAPNGIVLAVTGAAPSPSINGYCVRAGSEASFAVNDNGLYVAGLPVAGAQVMGTKLSWKGVTAEAQQVRGLPAAGTLVFDDSGGRFTVSGTGASGRRLTGDAAEALARNIELGGI